jgi:hypothetical protein
MADYPKPQLRLECDLKAVRIETTKSGKPLARLTVDVTAQRVRLDEKRTVRVPFLLPGLEMTAWQTKTAQELLPGDVLLCEVALSVWVSPRGYANLQARAEDIKVIRKTTLPPPAELEAEPAPPPFPARESPQPQPATGDDRPVDDIPF